MRITGIISNYGLKNGCVNANKQNFSGYQKTISIQDVGEFKKHEGTRITESNGVDTFVPSRISWHHKGVVASIDGQFGDTYTSKLCKQNDEAIEDVIKKSDNYIEGSAIYIAPQAKYSRYESDKNASADIEKRYEYEHGGPSLDILYKTYFADVNEKVSFDTMLDSDVVVYAPGSKQSV